MKRIFLILMLLVACTPAPDSAPEISVDPEDGAVYRFKEVQINPQNKPLKESAFDGQVTTEYTVTEDNIRKHVKVLNVEDDGLQADYVWELSVVQAPPKEIVYGEEFEIELSADMSGAMPEGSYTTRGMGFSADNVVQSWKVSPVYGMEGLTPDYDSVLVGFEDGNRVGSAQKTFYINWDNSPKDTIAVAVHEGAPWIAWVYERV